MKAILIEDRIERIDKFLNLKENKESEEFTFIDIYKGKRFEELKRKIESNNIEALSDYDLIMTHSSAFSKSNQNKIKKHCEENNIPLVFFSGGISQSSYTNSKYPFLNIDAKDFYSPNLLEFLKYIEKTKTIELRILQFGSKWKMTLLLKLRETFSNIIYQAKEENKKRFQPEEFEKMKSNETFELLSEELAKELRKLCEKGLTDNAIAHLELLKRKLSQFITLEVRK